MEHKYIVGNSADKMLDVKSGSIGLVISSPPYWDKVDYGHKGQMGTGQSFIHYTDDLFSVLNQCQRVLHPGCKLVINVGDLYVSNPYHIVSLQTEIISWALSTQMFDFMGSIIWIKMAGTKPSGGGTFMGSIYYPRDGCITYEHEYILIFKKHGNAPVPTREQKKLSKLTKEQRSKWFRGIWNLQPERNRDHPAPFPVELPERIVRMFSYYREYVLDPFAGSGSTALAADNAGRQSISFDIKFEYTKTAKRRVPNMLIDT